MSAPEPFGSYDPLASERITSAWDALVSVMADVGDPGPITQGDGAGRYWTDTYVYGVNHADKRVVALPRNPAP